jgi:hypothetical protein
MKKRPTDFAEAYRVTKGLLKSSADEGNNGAFCLRLRGQVLQVIISDGEGWDHVSVSCTNRCPTWAEMCWVKDIFFEPEESVMQLHPPKSEWISNHPNCLHLWRPQAQEIPSPPSYMVGFKSLGELSIKRVNG